MALIYGNTKLFGLLVKLPLKWWIYSFSIWHHCKSLTFAVLRDLRKFTSIALLVWWYLLWSCPYVHNVLSGSQVWPFQLQDETILWQGLECLRDRLGYLESCDDEDGVSMAQWLASVTTDHGVQGSFPRQSWPLLYRFTIEVPVEHVIRDMCAGSSEEW